MLGVPRKPPRVVTVRVHKASGLRNPYVESKKRRKENYKWKVKIKGGKKTMESYIITDPNGNPIWDFEATIEIVDVSQPVVIKVTDSDNHHIGQVVIPLIQIEERPAGLTSKPATDANLRVAELEPTKKISQVYGSIYFWIWAESFYDDGAPEKSSRSSIMGSERLHRSASKLSSHLHRHRDKDDGASVTGSTLSMYSTSGEKKKHWYNKNPIKHIHEKHGSGSSRLGTKQGSEIGYSMSQSMGSLFNMENDRASLAGRDSNVLDGQSANGSELYGSPGNKHAKMPPAPNSFTRVGSNRRMARPPSSGSELSSNMEAPRKPSVPSERPKKSPQQQTLAQVASKRSTPPLDSSDEGEEVSTQPPAASLSPPSSQPPDPPCLLSLSPSRGSPAAETVVYIYGKNLSESTMRHAVLLVDDYTVASYKWSVSQGSWSEEPEATHRLTLRMPPKKDSAGSSQVWIDVETMGHGRLRCPKPFVYEAEQSPPPGGNSANQPIATDFVRNSSIRLSDTRTRRGAHRPTEAGPLKSTSPPTSELGGFTRNSSIRLSDTRSRRSLRGGKAPPPLPSYGELPLSAGNRSSGLGSEESFSEATANTAVASGEANLAAHRPEASAEATRNASTAGSDRPVNVVEQPIGLKPVISEVTALPVPQRLNTVIEEESVGVSSDVDDDYASRGTNSGEKELPPAPGVSADSDVDEVLVIAPKNSPKPAIFEAQPEVETSKQRSPSPVTTTSREEPKMEAVSKVQTLSTSDNEGARGPPVHGLYTHDSEVAKQERPDPIGGNNLAHSRPYEEKAPPKHSMEDVEEDEEEEEDESSDSGTSVDNESDSARGDSLLPTVEENYSVPQSRPRILCIDPQRGSTTGEYEVCLYGVGLDEEVMRHAQVLIDVYTVPQQNWRVVAGVWPSVDPQATHCLRVRVPPMPAGEAWFEVETMSRGRLHCPEPFVFQTGFSVKHSMRGMGGGVSKENQPPASTTTTAQHQPAPSFADFKYTPQTDKEPAVPPLKPQLASLQRQTPGTHDNLDAAKMEIASLYGEISRLKLELQSKSADEARVARDLCLLRTRLLEDGQLKYLEKC
uniref:C2 domain-containing protein n=1 Tax=Mesocestoides corti TaxID=53468 RepID=A0A5K3FAR3_MESCO